MKISKILFLFLIGALLFTSACKKDDVKQDAANIADAMCRNIEIMNKIRAANPADSALMTKLHAEAKQREIEMTILYKEFGDKYGNKTKDGDFNKRFARELRKAMLDCKFLSKEDRAQFEKDLKE